MMPSKEAEHRNPTGGLVTQLEHHRRGRPVLQKRECSSADTNVFDRVAGGVVNSAIVLVAARDTQKSTGSGADE